MVGHCAGQELDDRGAEDVVAVSGHHVGGVGDVDVFGLGTQVQEFPGSVLSEICSEAAFAKLCGAGPITASSGVTNRHQLSRAGHCHAKPASAERSSCACAPPADHRLGPAPNRRGTLKEGDHPMPLAVPRPRGLPARHDRPPSPTHPRTCRVNDCLVLT